VANLLGFVVGRVGDDSLATPLFGLFQQEMVPNQLTSNSPLAIFRIDRKYKEI
jgi:hypothetical protein